MLLEKNVDYEERTRRAEGVRIIGNIFLEVFSLSFSVVSHPVAFFKTGSSRWLKKQKKTNGSQILP